MSEAQCMKTAADTASLSNEPPASAGFPVLFRIVNRVAIIVLNRPAALNALSHEMVCELIVEIERCQADKDIAAVVLTGIGDAAFCAGADLRRLYQTAVQGDRKWRQCVADEYRLIFALHQIRKPVVVLMDGLTRGGGIGLAQGASLRIVTENSRIGVLGAGIGFIPDGGAIWFLSKLPVELMLYFGLTAATMTGPDAISCGLADAYASSSSLRGYEKRLHLLDANDVRQSIRDVFVSPADVIPRAQVQDFRPLIRQHFPPHFSVEKCIESIANALRREVSPVNRGWLQATLDSLRAHSPLMLNVIREALLRGRQMTLTATFRMEFDLAMRAIEVGDFCEGVRALLIDEDRSPRWMFRTLGDVNSAVLEKFFSPWRRGETHPLSGLGTPEKVAA